MTNSNSILRLSSHERDILLDEIYVEQEKAEQLRFYNKLITIPFEEAMKEIEGVIYGPEITSGIVNRYFYEALNELWTEYSSAFCKYNKEDFEVLVRLEYISINPRTASWQIYFTKYPAIADQLKEGTAPFKLFRPCQKEIELAIKMKIAITALKNRNKTTQSKEEENGC